jgi:2-keto-3-deoxy-6-phosphogluconate aldolase
MEMLPLTEDAPSTSAPASTLMLLLMLNALAGAGTIKAAMTAIAAANFVCRFIFFPQFRQIHGN